MAYLPIEVWSLIVGKVGFDTAQNMPILWH